MSVPLVIKCFFIRLWYFNTLLIKPTQTMLCVSNSLSYKILRFSYAPCDRMNELG